MEKNIDLPIGGILNDPEMLAKHTFKTYREFSDDKNSPNVYSFIYIDGKEFKGSCNIEIIQHTNNHDTFTIFTRDDNFDSFHGYIMENSKNLSGKDISIEFKKFGELRQTFTGIIGKVENTKNEGGGYGKLIITGFAPSILLESGKDCQSFEDKTLEQIIKQIVSEYPQEAKIETKNLNTKRSLPYTVQYKETDYEFIQRLAILHGEYFYYNGQELIFGNKVQPIIQLEEGADLIDVQFELNTKPQDFSYIATDIDSGEVISRYSSQVQKQYKGNPFQAIQITSSKRLFKKKPQMHFNQTGSESELNEAVRKEKEKRENLVLAKGKSKNPELKIGGRAKLLDINDKPMETYRIIEIKHYFDGTKYYNEFVAIPDLFTAPYQDNEAVPFGEIQSARVLENNDPSGIGRVRVQFPWQMAKGEKSPWIHLIQPHSGAGKGFYFIPEIGEEVLVGYESGNAEKPFVMGTKYNEKERSGYHTAGNDKKVIHTRSGTKIILNDAEGSVCIEDPSGNTYHMDGQGNIKAKAPKNMTFEAGNDLYLKAGKNMHTIVGMNKTEFTGMNFTRSVGLNYISSISGNSTSKIKGESLTQGQSQFKIEAKQMDVAGFDNLFLHSDKAAKINSKGSVHVQGLEGTDHNNNPDDYSVTIEEKEAICIANIRPLANWKGEFGCDYFQSGNSKLGDEFDFSKLIGKYYKANDKEMLEFAKIDSGSSFSKHYMPNCNAWYSFKANPEQEKYDVVHNFKLDPQYKTQDNTLQKLQDRYTAFKYKKKTTDTDFANCYAGYISLFPSDWKTDAPKKADLKLHFDFLTNEKPDEIIFKFDDKPLDSNSPIKISPVSIPTPSETADITISSVERYKYSNINEDFISIKIIAKKKQGETYVETSAGEIRLMNPKKAKTLKILVMGVKTVTEDFGIFSEETKIFTRKILNQCLIDPEFISKSDQRDGNGEAKNLEIDLSTKNPKRLLNARKIESANKWEISDSKGELGVKLLLPTFLEKYPQYKSNEYFRLYVMDVDSQDNGSKENGYSSLGMNYCVLFKSADKTTLPHEALHGLGLMHTFCSNSEFTFKALVTHNIMDYSDMKNDPIETVTNFNNKTRDAPTKFVPLEQYQLWFWQWKKANETNTKV